MAELTRGPSSSELPSPGPFLAIITNHLDPSYMGALEVALLKKTGANFNQTEETHVVNYLSPFAGNTSVRYEGTNSASFNDVQKSYGFWMVPPDIGSTVMVIFLDGDPNQGYWFGCVQDRYQNFMTPGLASTQNVEITPEQEKKYGTKNLPTGEFHKKSRTPDNPNVNTYNKPIHPFADRLLAQGLLLDTVRGVTSSSARREIPSGVFGISTPGPLDPKGKKVTLPNTEGTQTPVSRLGGTTFVMDDGDEKGESELVRIRTRTGHQILLHNSQDLIYIANSRGTAWIELSSDGKIDMYANDSVSIHTEADFNFRAERDVNIEAQRNINFFAGGDFHQDVKGGYYLNVTDKGAITVGSTLDINVTDNITMSTAGELHVTSSDNSYFRSNSNFNIKSDSSMFIQSDADLNIKSATSMFIQTDADMNQISATDWKVTATEGSSNITSSHHIETADTIDMNGPEATAATDATAADLPDLASVVNPLQQFTLPNRDKENGWSDGKFYKAEDIISILKRIPTFEPWDQHENLNKEKFSKAATDLGTINSLSEVKRDEETKEVKYSSAPAFTPAPSSKTSPVISQEAKTTTQYKVPPATSGTPPAKSGDTAQDNISAFLWMIRNCEGTAGPDGYKTMFTGKKFDSFADHPRKAITAGVNGKGLTSTAAGAYQFLTTTWDECKRQLGLADFSPENQDKACILLLKRRKALDDIKAGRFEVAIKKCNLEWASLPGSPYNQHPKDMGTALALIKKGGGTMTA
jgi:muramidase (phage lysozyme)